MRGDAALIALLPDDTEVAQLQPPIVADEHVHRREVAVQHLAAMQPAQHVEDAGDLAPRRRLGEAALAAAEERAQVAVARVLERQAVDEACRAAARSGNVSKTRMARSWPSRSWPK